MRHYTAAECRRKANQHWDMAGLARRDHDMADAQRQTELARLWEQRAAEGGYFPEPPPSEADGAK